MPEIREVLEHIRDDLKSDSDDQAAKIDRTMRTVERMLSGEAIDPPKNFTGIQGTIEAVRGIRRSEEAARAVIAVSIPISKENKELVAEVMQMIKMPVFIGFGFMQGALDFLDDQTDPNAGQPPAPTTTPMSVNGQDAQPVARPRRNSRTDARDIVPHKFSDNIDNPGYCLYCKLGQMHQVHKDQVPAMDQAADASPDETGKLVESLLSELDPDAASTDDAPIADEDLTDEQREARARLAHEANQP